MSLLIKESKPATLLKRDFNTRCFPVNIGKFLKTYFEEHLRTPASEETLGSD